MLIDMERLITVVGLCIYSRKKVLQDEERALTGYHLAWMGIDFPSIKKIKMPEITSTNFCSQNRSQLMQIKTDFYNYF